jgi:hypothetical protein
LTSTVENQDKVQRTEHCRKKTPNPTMTRPRRSVPKIKYCVPNSDTEAEADESGNDFSFDYNIEIPKAISKPRNVRTDSKKGVEIKIQKSRKKVNKGESEDLSEASTKIKKEVSMRSCKPKDLDPFEIESIASHELEGDKVVGSEPEPSPLKPMNLDFDPFAESQTFSNLQSEVEDDDEGGFSKVREEFNSKLFT